MSKLTAELVIQSIDGWREEIFEAIASENPEKVLRHLEAKMKQTITFIEFLSRDDDIIRSEKRQNQVDGD